MTAARPRSRRVRLLYTAPASRLLGGGLLLALAGAPGCTSPIVAGSGTGGASTSSSTGLGDTATASSSGSTGGIASATSSASTGSAGGSSTSAAGTGAGDPSTSSASTGAGGTSTSSTSSASTGAGGAPTSSTSIGAGGAATSSTAGTTGAGGAPTSSTSTGAGGASTSSIASTSSTAASAGVGGASTSSTAASTGAGGASTSSSGTGGGTNLDCTSPGFGGGDTVWTTNRPGPGPISGFPDQPKGWSLDGVRLGTTGRIFVATSYDVLQPGAGNYHPVGQQLDELDSTGAFVEATGMAGSAGGIFGVAGVVGAGNHVFAATLIHGMGLHEEQLKTDTFSRYWSSLEGAAGTRGWTGNADGDLFVSFFGGGLYGQPLYWWSFPWGAEPPYILVKWSSAGQHIYTKSVSPNTWVTLAGNNGDVFLGGGSASGLDLGCGPLTGGAETSHLARLDASGQCLWSRTLDLDSSVIFSDLGLVGPSADGSDFVIRGSFTGTMDAGCGPMTSAPSGSSFVARLDAGGACVWSKSFAALDVRATRFPSGDLLLSVPLAGTVDFGGGPLTSVSTKDVAVARLDISGNHVWSKRFGAIGASLCTGYCPGAGNAAVTASGSVLLSGPLTGWVDFGGGPIGSMAEQTYAVKLDGAGNFLWHRQLPAKTYVTPDPCGAAITANDNGTDVTVTKLAP